jgi:hypothetical protein
MTDQEAMKLALEALQTLMIERGSIYDKAITAIKEALAQPERTWVGLTEQEALDCFSPNPVTHSKNVEAKLKEKNT